MIRFSVESSLGRDSQCSATLLHPTASRHLILFSHQHFQPVGNALFAWTTQKFGWNYRDTAELFRQDEEL